MKKLLAATVLLASTAAFANDDSKAIDATEVGPTIEKKTENIKDGAKEAGKELKTNSRELARQAGAATESQGTFKSEHAYDVQGRAIRTAGGKVTLEREGLPPATLDVRDNTQITLDGRKVEAKYIPEGALVRAKFQLEGNATVAVALNATSLQIVDPAKGRTPAHKVDVKTSTQR